MRYRFLPILFLASVFSFQPTNANAWNATGHKVIASICYRQMSATQRASVIATLKKHPRFTSDFANQMPAEIRNGSEDQKSEWLFQQAAVWPDIVRSGPAARTAFHRARWHFVNVPHFLTEADRLALEDHVDVNLQTEPPANDFDDRTMNIVAVIKNSDRIIQSQTQLDAAKALHICWLLHGIGDLHQPLHSTALFSRSLFPQGDRGGNSVKTRQLSNLHSAWDASFGTGDSFTNCRNIAIQLLSDSNSSVVIGNALSSNDPVVWRDESVIVAKEHAYNHEVSLQLTALENSGDDIDHNEINLSQDYLRNRRSVANVQAVLAGVRVATVLAGNQPHATPHGLHHEHGVQPLEVAGVPGSGPDDTSDRIAKLEEKIDRLTGMVKKLLARSKADD